MQFSFSTLVLLAPLLSSAQNTFTLSGCTTLDNGVVNCVLGGTTIPWTTRTPSQTSSSTPAAVPASTTPAPVVSASSPAAVTSLSGCHLHGTDQFCFGPSSTEYRMVVSASATSLPTNYGGCHSHGTELYCISPITGEEVEAELEGGEASVASSPASTSASPSSSASSAVASAQPTSVTGCHLHATDQFCFAPGGVEYKMVGVDTSNPSALPMAYSGCHSHGSELFCISPSGQEVKAELEGGEGGVETTTSVSGATLPEGVSCHFHAGVEHCVDAQGNTVETSCAFVARDYNVPLRIGLVFVILATSAIGVFAPVFLAGIPKLQSSGYLMVILKNFGTGVILSTSLVHLFTHATLMFENNCLDGLDYEATTAAIALAGVMLSFLPDYIGTRIVLARTKKLQRQSQDTVLPGTTHNESKSGMQSRDTAIDLTPANLDEESANLAKMKVMIMECGIIFHSLLIGLTLVVAGDSSFKVLFVVILFHQMFEGLALGARIGALKTRLGSKLIMATAFALVTPIGMAIGIGVLNQFNGNNPATIISIGTLDALSAGILLWVGLVELLAHDWLYGELRDAPLRLVIPAAVSLIAGIVLMSFLGKWA